MEKVVRTICQGCHSECGVLVHVDGDSIVKIEPDPHHPSSRGYICIKGKHYGDFTHHPDRLKHPLRRTGKKGEGKWEKILWDKALDEIASRLTEVKEKYGVKSIGTFHGTAPRQSLLASHLLASALGTPNVISTDLHICFAPSMVAEIATVGHSIMQEEGPDYHSSRCILVCGGNPLVSHPPRGRDLLEAIKKNGAKLIVIDPRPTSLAEQADLWFRIRPGTDGALILGMLHTIISEKLYDNAFVEKYCHGFEELKEHVKDYPAERVAKVTWLSATKIREAARLFARTRPATVHHRVAVEQNLSSTQSARALVILAAITGNIAIKGGNLLPTHVPGYIGTGEMIGRCKLPSEAATQRLGGDEFPLISGPNALFVFVHAAVAAKAMLYGEPYPLKALFVGGGNPVVNMQNTRRTWEAFKSLELLVVSDFFATPTTELADYVLPATTWLERDECCEMQYMNCAASRQEVLTPLFESRDDLQMVIDLVKRIPWANRKYVPWESVEEFNDFRVKGIGVTFKEFKQKGYVISEPQYKQYKEKGFATPTGKVEIYSTIFERHGYSPLPTYVEPRESPASTPKLLKDYPYILITGGRTMEYYHSSGRQIKALRERLPDPEIEVHPEAAQKENIREGDWVWVETPQVKGERVRLRAKFASRIDPRVLHAYHGWWFPENPAPDHGCFESNIDLVLSDDPPREKICGSVPTRGTLCKIYKC